MPPLPPLKDVLEALQQSVLPGAGGAALVMCAFLLLGRWAGAVGAAAAVSVAFAWGNFTLAGLGSDPPSWANTSRLVPWTPGADAPGYQWLARAALVLVGVGLVSRWLGQLAGRALPERYWWGANVLVWAPRAAAVFVVSAWLVLGNAAAAEKWAALRWELVAAMLVLWLVLDALARDGTGAELTACLAATFLAGSAILLYAHTAKFMELAVVVGSALFGVAVASGVARPRDGTKLDVSGAIPAAAVFLPGLLLGGRPSLADNKVPVACFWLVALAPLLLAPFLIPRVSLQNRWLVFALRAVLVLTPLVVAVVMAGQHEKFPFEEAEEW